MSIRVLGNNGDSGLWYVNGVLVLHTDEQHKVTERARGLLLLATRIQCLLLAHRRYRGAVVSVGGCRWQGEVLGGDLVEASDDGSESEVRVSTIHYTLLHIQYQQWLSRIGSKSDSRRARVWSR